MRPRAYAALLLLLVLVLPGAVLRAAEVERRHAAQRAQKQPEYNVTFEAKCVPRIVAKTCHDMPDGSIECEKVKLFVLCLPVKIWTGKKSVESQPETSAR